MIIFLDIALIRLKDEFNNVEPIDLNVFAPVRVNMNATVLGWGDTGYGSSNDLMKADVRVEGYETDSGNILVLDEGSNSGCQGDSGGRIYKKCTLSQY